MNSLTNNDKAVLGLENNNSIYSLIDCLKKKNKNTNRVTWQNQPIRTQQIEENKEHIRLYNSCCAPNGYLCSTCDPFIILLCELLEIDIVHNYLGNNIMYKNTHKSKGTVYFKSNRGHFWFTNRK